MMLTTFILLITANYALCAEVTRPVTVSIVFRADNVNCRGTDTFDNETGLGRLDITSTGQSAWAGFTYGVREKVKTILDTLENPLIAKNYCLKKKPISNVLISMVTEGTMIPSYIDNVTLQILPDVQVNITNEAGEDEWSVTIPYLKEEDTVRITEVEQNLSLLGKWNRTFACLKIHVENLDEYPSLKVGKSELLKDFMTLKNSTLPMFLENKPLHDAEGKEVEAQPNFVLPITFGEIVDREDGYYVEYSIDDGAYVEVKVTTPDTEYPVRYVRGFTNMKGDQVMFFPTALIEIVTANDPNNFIDAKQGVSWAFAGATKLELAVEPAAGSQNWDYVEIVLAELSNMSLQNGALSRDLKLLPLSVRPLNVPAAPAPSLLIRRKRSVLGCFFRRIRGLMKKRTTHHRGCRVN